jgi:death-on-curing protein
MPSFVWLRLDAILAVHEVSLQRFGGIGGVRDTGLLASALARPEMLAHSEPNCSPFQLAAGYAYGIARNHPFLDGIKRTAFLAAYMFLLRNGWKLAAPQTSVVITMVGVAAGSITEEALAEWLEANSRKMTPPGRRR